MGKLVLTLILLVLSQASSVLSLLYLIDRLSSEDAGRLSTSLTIQTYAALVGGLGLRTILVREVTRSPHKLPQLLVTSFQMTFWSGMLAGVGSIFFAGVFLGGSREEQMMRLWLAGGTWFAVMSPSPFFDAMQRQSASMAIVAGTELIAFLALISGRIPLNLSSIGALFAVKWTIACLLHGALLSGMVTSWASQLPKHSRILMLLSAFPLLLTSLVSQLPIAGSVLLVRKWHGPASASIVGLGAQIATAYLLIAGVAFRYVQPLIRSADDLRDLNRRRYLRNIAWGLLGAWLAIIVVTWGLVTWVLPMTYCEGFPVIAAIGVSGLLGAAGYLGWAVLLALECERAILVSYVAGAVVFLGISWGLARMGPLGIALASCLGAGTTVVLMTHFHNRALLRRRRVQGEPAAR